MRFLLPILAVWFSAFIPAFAAGDEHHALPLYAQKVFGDLPITNSMIMTWIAALIVIVFARIATRQMQAVPSGMQNLAEWLVESLYNFLEGILGAHLVKRTFWFFGGVFILILVTNWIGLLPGVGTVGWSTVDAQGHKGWLPLLRGGNADLNMTAALSLIFTALWFYWAITENGVAGFLKHIFAPKGHFAGFMKIFMMIIFFVVGVIEVFSILLRPVALSFRLFGNIFAGETMLETMMTLVPKQIAFLPALPFYFLELLVGLIQALVFMLLTSVFLKLICDHGDDHHEKDH